MDGLNKAPAVVSRKKMEWINAQHIRRLALTSTGLVELQRRLEPFWVSAGVDVSRVPTEYLERVIAIVHERATTLAQLPELAMYFINEPGYETDYAKELRASLPSDTPQILMRLCDALAKNASETFDATWIEPILKDIMATSGVAFKSLMHALRFAILPQRVSPGMVPTMSCLGREVCLRRLRQACSLWPDGGSPAVKEQR